MNNLKHWIMAAIVLVVIGGVGSLISFLTMKEYNIHETKTVDTHTISRLDVQLDNGKILLQETDGDQIRVELNRMCN